VNSVEQGIGTRWPGARSPAKASLAEWIDQQTRRLFIMPAVLMILVFSIFPLIASAILALSRVRLQSGGYAVRFVGFANFEKQLFGSERIHFLGNLGPINPLGWVVTAAVGGLLLWWLFGYLRGPIKVMGLLGRLLTGATLFGVTLMFAATLFSGRPFGSLGVTLFYVLLGCAAQFLIGLGLAIICAKPIRARTFFRVVFFLPLMITPIGIGYAFRMLADTTKGPFAPVWQWVGLGDFAWVSDPWAARLFIVVGDSWQWIPFIFVVLLAALENVPRDLVEAGHVDGASGWQIFREITWPQIAPVAATVMLIRVIEAFKLVDLPNIMTAGGPGIATESMTLHAFFSWRALDLAQSAAVSYLLLFVTVVMCASFFNLVVLRRRARAA
jgi:multiple sugar transport system permease protein